MTHVMVRVYTLEAEKNIHSIIKYLHDTVKVKGVTVFRGVSGFGSSGEIHTSSLLTLSLNLPLVIEFFDEKERIDEILSYLKSRIETGHITSWPIDVI